MKFLHSDDLRLEPLNPDFINSDYIETLNDENYMQHSRHVGKVHTLESQLKYISNFNSFDSWIYAICTEPEGKFIGTTNLFFDFQEKNIDIGFLIFKHFSGKGYAGQVLELLRNKLKDEFPNFQINIGTNKANIPMRRIAEKAGFLLQDPDLDGNPSVRYCYFIDPILDFDKARIPLFIRWAKNVGVVAFDAGGAEQVKSLVSELDVIPKVLMGGPAKSILRDSKIPFDEVSDIGDLSGCQLIITGSGWMSSLENEAIAFCDSKKIVCVTILDHWVNYIERFRLNPGSNPRLLFVTNPKALHLARNLFPDKSIWPIPDFQVYRYQEVLRRAERTRDCVLIVLEPLSSVNAEFEISIEVVKRLILAAISIKQSRGLNRVVVRPHPSQMEDKSFLSMLEDYASEFHLSKGMPLLKDLETSDVVVGLSSYAMYISFMCGIDTYSYFASETGHWTRSFPEIMSLPESS